MFGFRLSVKWVAGVLLAAFAASGASAVDAQSTHRSRRESNANRKARIERTIDATYSHRYEVAGGGGFLRFQSGQYLQRNDEVSFWVTTTYFLNRKLGIIGDVRGAYGNAKIGNPSLVYLPFRPQISEYPLMGGVAYRLYAKEKFAVTATGEGGVALGKFDGDTKGFPSRTLGLWQSRNKPVASVGVNLDYNFYPNLAMRFTPTYVATFYQLDPLDPAPQPHGSVQNNFGFNVGLVYRFGHIK
jgi:Outer membrane protein beta-barrel domain